MEPSDIFIGGCLVGILASSLIWGLAVRIMYVRHKRYVAKLEDHHILECASIRSEKEETKVKKRK